MKGYKNVRVGSSLISLILLGELLIGFECRVVVADAYVCAIVCTRSAHKRVDMRTKRSI